MFAVIPPSSGSSSTQTSTTSTTPSSTSSAHPSAEQLLLFSRQPPEKSEEAGFVSVDLDEAALGFQAAITNAQKIASEGSTTGLMQDFTKEASQLTSTPSEWFRGQVSHTSPSDAAMGFAVSVVVLPLAVMAIIAGAGDIYEASVRHAELTDERKEIKDDLASLRETKGSIGVTEDSKKSKEGPGSTEVLQKDPYLEAEHHKELGEGDGSIKKPPKDIRSHARKIEKQSLQAINSAVDHNFYDGGIGCSSFASGLSIIMKLVPEIVVQSMTLATAKITAGLTMATTVIGMLGTLFLAPLGAISAVSIGGFFVHRARMVGKELEEDLSIINKVQNQNLRGVSSNKKCANSYEAFIEKKFTTRQNFTERFKRWNAGFLGGACCYALSAFAKAGLGIAAAAGAAALASNPAGLAIILGVLLALGIAGGITMGVCCWQFLVLNGRAKAHQAYRLQESHFLGRRFDAFQTTFAAMPENTKGGTQVAATLRDSLYEFVSQRDKYRQDFLDQIAAQIMQSGKSEQETNDDSSQDLISKESQQNESTSSYWTWTRTYIGRRFKGKTHEEAIEEARKVCALEAGLAGWLSKDDEESEEIQCGLLSNMLKVQEQFLDKKLGAYKEFAPLFLENKELAPEVRKSFAQAEQEAIADKNRLDKISKFLENFQKWPLDELKRSFLTLQGVNSDEILTVVSAAELNERLAQYLRIDLSEDLKATRGILFDMHRQSFHLQHRFLPKDQRILSS